MLGKLTIRPIEGTKFSVVELNGVDISEYVTSIEFTDAVHDVPRASLGVLTRLGIEDMEAEVKVVLAPYLEGPLSALVALIKPFEDMLDQKRNRANCELIYDGTGRLDCEVYQGLLDAVPSELRSAQRPADGGREAEDMDYNIGGAG